MPTSSCPPFSACGPRPLAAMALEVVTGCIDRLDREHAEMLSAAMAERLLELLEAKGRVDLHAWTLLAGRLAKIYLRGRGGGDNNTNKAALQRRRFRMFRETSDQQPLRDFTAPLCSAQLEFLVHVRIVLSHRCGFDVGDLVGLAALPNLAVLELGDGSKDDEAIIYGPETRSGLGPGPRPRPRPGPIDDRLLRSWSLLGNDPFPVLRILRLQSSVDMLSPASCLASLTRLRALVLLEIRLTGSVDNIRYSWSSGSVATLGRQLGWQGVKSWTTPGRGIWDSADDAEDLDAVIAVLRAVPPLYRDNLWAYDAYALLATRRVAIEDKSGQKEALSENSEIYYPPIASLYFGRPTHERTALRQFTFVRTTAAAAPSQKPPSSRTKTKKQSPPPNSAPRFKRRKMYTAEELFF